MQATLDKAAGLPAEPPGPNIFRCTIQANVGIGMGALFAVVYALCLDRVGNIRPRTLALLVAGGGFLEIYLVPSVNYPANPPAIGHPDTIGTRGGPYLMMVACPLAFLDFALRLGRRLKPRSGNPNATPLAGGAFIVLIGIVTAILPPLGHLAENVREYSVQPTETPLPLRNAQGTIVYPGFPADTLLLSRFYSLAAQLILGTTLAQVFGPLAKRLLAPKRQHVVAEQVSVAR